MRLVILDDYDKASDWSARYIKKRIHDFNPGPDKYFVMGLPTGELQYGNYAHGNCPLVSYCMVTMVTKQLWKHRYPWQPYNYAIT